MICAAVRFAICAGPATTSTTAWRSPGTRRGRSLTATTLLMRTTRGGRWSGSRNTSASRSNRGGKSSRFGRLDELSQNKHKRAIFLGKANLIFQAQTFDWALSVRGNSLLGNNNSLAERVGFEPTLPFRVNLISSQAPSAGLGHLSTIIQLVSRYLGSSQSLCTNVVNITD